MSETKRFHLGDEDMLFFEALSAFAAEGKPKKGIIHVFRKLDGLLHKETPEAFAHCDRLLQKVPVDALPLNISLAFITITSGIPKAVLPSREALYSRVRARAVQELGPSQAADLLDSLR